MPISQHISELLFSHECVIVPGLGGFVSNYQPATIHPVQHNFHPPARNILFNKELNKNDGLLVNHIVVAEVMTYEAAMEMIRNYARDVMLALGQGEKVTIEKVGMLHTDVDGNIQFDQELGVNYLKEAYGLSTFVSPAIRRQFGKTPRTTQPAFSDRRTRPQAKMNTGTFVRIAAAASIVLFVSVFGFNYFTGSKSETNQSSVMPVISLNNAFDEQAENADNQNRSPFLHETYTDKQQDNTPEINNEENQTETFVSDLAIPESKKDEIKEIALNTVSIENTPEIVSIPKPKMYHLIAGSFQESENAASLINTFKANGYEPLILAQSDNGYFRVSISAYLRKDEALAELKKVRDNFNPNVWLLRQ